VAVPKIFQDIVDTYGEADAKKYLRRYFAKPENVPAFAMLFHEHVPTYPPDFHLEILELYTTTRGHVGGAAPRGFAKSTTTSVVYLAWRTLNATSRFSLLIGDTWSQAVLHLASLKDELEENTVIKWLYGDVMGSQWSEDEIIVMGTDDKGRVKECKIMALGAGQKVRGLKFKNFRVQLMICDDLENDEAVQSKERREKLRRWLVRAALPAIDRQVGRCILIGTMLHKRSLLSAIVSKEKEFSSWTTFLYSGIKENGQSLWPELYPVEEILAWRDDPNNPNYIGAVAFAQEIQNKPLAEGQQIIQTEWLEKDYNLGAHLMAWQQRTQLADHLVLDNWLSHHFSVISGSVDPAISEKQTADWWTMATVGVTKQCPICPGGPAGHVVQLDMLRMREADPMKQVSEIIENYQEWQHGKLRIEAIAYQSGLLRLVKNTAAAQGLYPPIKPYRPAQSKRARAIVHAALFSGGMVHLRKDHPLYQAFYDELVEFPQGDHDDMFDSYMSAADAAMRRRPRGYTQKPAGM